MTPIFAHLINSNEQLNKSLIKQILGKIKWSTILYLDQSQV